MIAAAERSELHAAFALCKFLQPRIAQGPVSQAARQLAATAMLIRRHVTIQRTQELAGRLFAVSNAESESIATAAIPHPMSLPTAAG